MNLARPKFALFDTATIVRAAESPGDAFVKELMVILRAGTWIPFLTFHQLEELASHGSNDVVRRRFDFLQCLPLVGYVKKLDDDGIAGSSLDLRDREIEFLSRNPTASHSEVIDAVATRIRSGFHSGEQFVKENIEWWNLFRQHLLTETRQQSAEIANLTHFPVSKNSERIPAAGDVVGICSEEQARKHFRMLARSLGNQILEHGDCRGFDPQTAADDLMRETFGELQPLFSVGKNAFDKLLAHFGVERSRLPPNPRWEDVGYEGIFVGQMSVHARRLLRNKQELLSIIRKERIPSWVVWQEVDRRLKQLPKAEIGNINDKHIACFGLYMDLVNVDKRIAEVIRQGAHRDALMRRLHERVPTKRGLTGLLDALKVG